ncbi:unnamed protein product [Paramecium pentaurelia]|uniref:Uncharacterized protein n=1 Tax=Paramecium pentaurelia TaxID=43138 RepID=A0A8S1V977_9CILI|nr:unnamed protein product [Paramecium pentaurelia]
MEELVQQMIAISGGQLNEEKAKQYLKYGKNDLELALNYYYQAEERKKRQQPTLACTKLMEGAKKQQQLEKILKDLNQEYKKPIEECLDQQIVLSKPSGNLDFQQTNDIEEIAIQYAQEKRQAKFRQSSEMIKQQINEEDHKNTQLQNQQQKIKKKQNKIREQKDQILEEGESKKNDDQEIKQKKNQNSGLKLNSGETTIIRGITFPLFIGSAKIKGYALGSQNLKDVQQQCVEIILDGTCKVVDRGKKSNKVVKGQNIIRICYDEREIGRLNSEYEDLFSPLLQENYIKIIAYHVQSQILCKTHDTILLQIDVFLNEKALSDGTSDQFDDTVQEFVKYSDNFQKLYDLVNCKLITSTKVDVIDKKKIENNNLEIKENSNNNTLSKSAVTYQEDPFKQKPKQLSLNDFKLKNNVQDQNQSQLMKVEIDKDKQQNEMNEEIDCDQFLGFNNCTHHDLEMHDGPKQLGSKLFDYQKQALTWLLQREGVIKAEDESSSNALHPLWKEYQTSQGVKIYFNPFSGLSSLDFPSSSRRCNGGILADEMGLGKTVMLISLILANPFKIPQDYYHKSSRKNQNYSGKKLIGDYVGYKKKKWARTLIIVPVSLLQQWQDELNYHCSQHLRIFQYTGAERNQSDLCQYDVVVSSYHTVSVEFKKPSKDPYSIYNYNWFRVILDEAHYIKGRTTLLAQGAYELDCYYRWCSTGTPIQNNLNDIFSLIHFIKLEPWSDYLWWNAYINKPHEEGKDNIFPLLNSILRPILLRRTKKSKDQNGKPIISLPNKEIHFESIELRKDERMVYDKMEKKSQDEVEGYLAKGILMSQYMKVFELLIRLRQICDHPLLITSRSDVKNIDQLEEQIDKFLSNQALDREDQEELLMNDQQVQICQDKQQYKQEVLRRVKENDIPPCPVCLEQVEDTIVTICLHFLCRLCLYGILANSSECPYCRQYLTKQDTMTLPRESSFSLNWKENYKRSSKIEKVMQILQAIPKNEKCVIFTQFIGMIQMIEFDLDNQKIKHLRLDGSMPQQERAEVLRTFKESDEYRIFIISLKAGGVGLNLTAANHVIMIDPWWNPAVEEQAIERVYRIGQTKETHVYRLICKQTVEERMIKLHDIKKQLFESSIRTEERSNLRMEMFKNIILGS